MSPTVSLPILKSIRIASPCHVRWEDMRGDDHVRHCDSCNLKVHNISGMSAGEAEAFLAERLGRERVCGLLHLRSDGTILTRDCPVGVARWRKHAAWAVGRVAAAAGFLICAAGLARAESREGLRVLQPFRAVCQWLNPSKPIQPTVIMAGVICPPPIPLPPGPAPSNQPAPQHSNTP